MRYIDRRTFMNGIRGDIIRSQKGQEVRLRKVLAAATRGWIEYLTHTDATLTSRSDLELPKASDGVFHFKNIGFISRKGREDLRQQQTITHRVNGTKRVFANALDELLRGTA